jgi:hypothetical protein
MVSLSLIRPNEVRLLGQSGEARTSALARSYSPQRPAHQAGELWCGSDEQGGEKATDLGNGHGDPLRPPCRVRAAIPGVHGRSLAVLRPGLRQQPGHAYAARSSFHPGELASHPGPSARLPAGSVKVLACGHRKIIWVRHKTPHHQAVAVPGPGPRYRKITKSGGLASPAHSRPGPPTVRSTAVLIDRSVVARRAPRGSAARRGGRAPRPPASQRHGWIVRWGDQLWRWAWLWLVVSVVGGVGLSESGQAAHRVSRPSEGVT